MTDSLASILNWPPGQAPYAKQEEAFALTANKRLAALLMEQRTGKTPVALGTAAFLYRRFLDEGGFSNDSPLNYLPRRFVGGKINGETKRPLLPRISFLPKSPDREMIYRPGAWATKGLDALLVFVMPSGVALNWKAEADLRLPAWVNARTWVWKSDRAETIAAAELKELLDHRGLACFFVNGEALGTEDLRKAVGTFLRTRRALTIVDESSLVCPTPGGVRARTLDAIAKLPGAVARRILDGTPGDESPFDYWQQFSFLDRRILGFETFSAFKQYHAEWAQKEVWIKDKKTGIPKANFFPAIAVDPATGKKLYKNLGEIAEKIAPVSFRVLRRDCFDVPEKVPVPFRFELSDAQRAVYGPLDEELEAYLGEKKVTAANVLARLVRLDQVASNFWPSEKVPTICAACGGDGCEACGDVGAVLVETGIRIIDPKRNPRVEAFAEVLSLYREPGIAWCSFNETGDAVMAAAAAAGRAAVRYDGTVSDEEKAANFAAFKEGRADLLVSKEGSAGRGLDGRAARWLCYVESSYSQRKRSQSEDRAEVAGRDRGTAIVDLIAVGTRDEDKVAARAEKLDVAAYVERRLRRAA